MIITIKELEANLDKYLDMVEEEDIYITDNGRVISKMTKPYFYDDKKAIADVDTGIII